MFSLVLRRRPRGPSIRLAPRPWFTLITQLAAAWRRRQHAQACRRSLARLDDALLRDLGLARGDLASAAAQLAAGERPKGWR